MKQPSSFRKSGYTLRKAPKVKVRWEFYKFVMLVVLAAALISVAAIAWNAAGTRSDESYADSGSSAAGLTSPLQVYTSCGHVGTAISVDAGSYRNMKAAGVPANERILSVRIPNGVMAMLYEQEDFDSVPTVWTNWFVYATTQTCIQRPVLSLRVMAAPTFYSNCNFGGSAFTRVPGRYEQTDLGRISSVRIPSGFLVTLYEYDGFEGENVTLSEDIACLSDVRMASPGMTWERKTRSAKVEALPVLYPDLYFQGTGVVRGAGSYVAGDMGPWAVRSISSLTIPDGYAVTLYDQPGLSGENIRLTADVPSLLNVPTQQSGRAWNDQVASFSVEKFQN